MLGFQKALTGLLGHSGGTLASKAITGAAIGGLGGYGYDQATGSSGHIGMGMGIGALGLVGKNANRLMKSSGTWKGLGEQIGNQFATKTGFSDDGIGGLFKRAKGWAMGKNTVGPLGTKESQIETGNYFLNKSKQMASKPVGKNGKPAMNLWEKLLKNDANGKTTFSNFGAALQGIKSGTGFIGFGAGAGAIAGGFKGAFSENDSMVGGAFKGALLGASAAAMYRGGKGWGHNHKITSIGSANKF